MGLNLLAIILTLILTVLLIGVQADEYHSSGSEWRARRSTRAASGEQLAEFWNFDAQHRLLHQLSVRHNHNIAKNVILFLGDGMSVATLAASRMYLGQLQGHTGEESRLFFEDFPYTGLAKTYCVDKQVADSACTATAYLTGVKANYATIGVTAAVKRYNCTSARDTATHVDSLAAWAQKTGKGTGFVTTARVTHASPAGVYAHTANRDWESDADVVKSKENPKMCQDIASQLINSDPGRKLKVILGGGRNKLLPKGMVDEQGSKGERIDGVNLIHEWMVQKKRRPSAYVSDRKGLMGVDTNSTEYLLGLFAPDHMDYNLEAQHEEQPSLAEMTVAAIEMLSKEKRGYFLFVEGARIDMAHHKAKAHLALDETVQFAEAVRMATELTNARDTLIVVTSDHSHTMTISGYAERGNNILDFNSQRSNVDNLPYTTLMYANGPGAMPRANFTDAQRLSQMNPTVNDFVYPAHVPLKDETHGGDDVAVFANGPWAHLFVGMYEQNLIPHAIGYASCIGEGLTACRRPLATYSTYRRKH
ncbi:membrane-bound alkaline phosphatase-like [Phlebotomus argentipes]|uniref:membrane-bound alkaline phosphatase-like n=1 Tax=Phlebotomus argentipes TaxID=94469 RepID=UPI00289311AE|nr:membrane-bound alkaline phosphatase-like [Phlebotomus argentipes]